jgi:hypothetical protein
MRSKLSAPIDANDRFAQQIKALQEQVAELQRTASRNPWPWTTYTPTLAGTGWAIGNGTIVGRAKITPDLVHLLVKLTFGSSSTSGVTTPTLSLPVAPHADWTDFAMRSSTRCTYADATGGNTDGRCALSGGALLLLVENAAGTYAADAVVTNAVPHPWVTPDSITVTGWYRPA